MMMNNDKKDCNKIKSRGFVTIATGAVKYHKMAYLLMVSYKLTSKNPCRFAVITDKKSKYTDSFDDVVVDSNATRTYMDKVDLLKNAPYDENIFIDADCIAFRDLNEYWNVFATASDFSCFGKVFSINSNGTGLYSIDKLGKYKDSVSDVLGVHGGIYYFRKCETCDSMYQISHEIIENYSDLGFTRFNKPADEPVLALAMAIHHCKPVEAETHHYVWLRRGKNIRADFFRNYLSYDFNNGYTDKGLMLHFGTSHTIIPLYIKESRKVLFQWRNKRSWNYTERMLYTVLSYVQATILMICFSYKKVLKIFKL